MGRQIVYGTVFVLGVLSFWTAPVFSNAHVAHAAGTSCLPGVLRRRLAQIRAKFGRVRVISTYRRGARIRGTGRPSLHASCRAVDFHPPRGKYRAVVRWLKANHSGGVGTYSCRMHHIHIDNGPRVRFHKCIR
ncbi:MAG: D-Ala-D-Ala carboxypeptidase family metallohydrolase [Pseudomonadota bacterium]